MENVKVLFIDDDITLGKEVTLALKESGYKVYYQTSLAAIKSVILDIKPDIIVLDVKIGEKNSIDITPELKIIAPDIPILFVSSHINSDEVVRALNAGGIAYLKKPFEIEELLAYINRHTQMTSTSWEKIPVGNLTLDVKENILTGEDKILHHLTSFECKLLKLLIINKNQIVPREEIEKILWGEGKGNEHSLNNYIAKLRKYLISVKEVDLVTIPKVGYKLIL